MKFSSIAKIAFALALLIIGQWLVIGLIHLATSLDCSRDCFRPPAQQAAEQALPVPEEDSQPAYEAGRPGISLRGQPGITVAPGVVYEYGTARLYPGVGVP